MTCSLRQTHLAPLSIAPLMFYVAACDLWTTKALFVSYWMHRGQEESKAGWHTISSAVAIECYFIFLTPKHVFKACYYPPHSWILSVVKKKSIQPSGQLSLHLTLFLWPPNSEPLVTNQILTSCLSLWTQQPNNTAFCLHQVVFLLTH